MASTKAGDNLVRVTPDGAETFVLHPEDDDPFVRSGQQVIAACQLGIRVGLWMDEVQAMAERLAGWSRTRAEKVRSCHLAFRGGRIAVFVVPTSGRFDFDLADEIAELNTDLVKSFNVGMVEVQQIPAGELDRFVNPDSTRHIYWEKPGTLPTVGA